MIFLDTNYFLRFLLADVSVQHQKAVNVFTQAAEEKIRVGTSLVVILELFWVLSSYYKKSKREVIMIMQSVLALQFIDLPERRNLQKTLLLYKRSSIEFEDCYNLVYATTKGLTDFKTFDKKLERVLARELSGQGID